MYSGGYKNLKVWQKSVDFAVLVYEATKNFPSSELYGLVSQMRRCSVSIASNIAEGSARQSKKEFAQFLAISLGSLAELSTQAILAKRLRMLTEEHYYQIEQTGDEIGGMLNRLRASQSAIHPRPKLVSINPKD